ncbi:MAG: MjaI family restriction endonuclease [Deltaproteobacteria bacterium]|nr:MAG: MjaI family restriction endonuclease [Deltaproteobacteria bacterium]
MAKEWILNMATNRWGLNKKESVGPVSLWIRECDPRDIEEWKDFYYDKLRKMIAEKGINLAPEEYIQDLGRKLYTKITEVIQAEIEEVTEEDCVQYIYGLVINRTFDGYQTEIKTIYGQLQRILKIPIKPAPDEWDRLYNVDFYIEIGGKYIGLQIKPITYEQTPEIYRWKEWLSRTHKRFMEEKGGKVFIVFSVKEGNKKIIYNQEVIEEIEREIERLSKITLRS